MIRYLILWTLLLSQLTIFGSESTEKTEQNDRGMLAQAQPFLSWNVTVGGFFQHHRAGVFTGLPYSYDYRFLGAEYAYHLSGAAKDGFYGKAYALRRWYKAGFETNARENTDPKKKNSPVYDTLDHHKENHYGVLIGYQGMMFQSKHLYIQTGIGWQYNDNPVKLGPTVFGLGNDITHWNSTTGELAIGYLLF